MAPNHHDEGLIAAATIRSHHPAAVLVLSQHIETRHAIDLVSTGGGFGYLLKDRVLDAPEQVAALDEYLRNATGD